MRKTVFTAVIIVAALLVSSNSFAQQKNTIGVVDVEAIVKELPDAGIADKMLKDLQKKYNDSLVKMQDDFLKRVDQYQKQKNMMPADKQQKEEEKFKVEQDQLMKYRDEKLQEIGQKREEYLEPIRKKVRAAIQDVAKEENMSFIFDKGSAAVLFSEDKFDLTFKVIDRIKRGAK